MVHVTQRVSLTKRVLVTSSIALLVALAAIGIVMDQAFKEKTLHLVKERLESYVLGIISNTEVDGDNLIFPEYLPTPRMERPGSGMYAQIIVGDQGWQSPSVLGQDLPEVLEVAVNERVFDAPIEFNGERLFRMRQGFVLTDANGSIELTVSVTEDAGNFYAELAEFEENLLTWLVVISSVLVCVQWIIMYWATKPLKRLTADLLKLEKGDELIFSENYPSELRGLTTSLNRLIENERSNFSRQRRTLGDLAHSLKTPLAVIHAELEGEKIDKDLMQQQILNMNEIVAYQLKRAAVAGHRTFVTGVPVIDVLDKIINTLKKIHPEKNISVSTQIAPGAEFYGEKGDLMEVLGNLLENAFKWCEGNIDVLVKTLYMEGRRRTGLIIEIADDGPGIPVDKSAELLKRGVRGDEKVKGHGIGLSIVTDIVESYQGELKIKSHKTLKGACFKVILPP
ncbi:ATP-binding protein [Marinicella sp. S1101]|uniref:ATP-binding protein n=1 Tax=Marinicella marina TaxID=2996016 RepID=UPI002260E3A3|nr:ATP-binding protein [Marinicella marina]MCX7554567.1 ATP-binding protein [Marinicella marina]MDJ1141049.1 ATP-binding protein [Marinicella marina]